DACRDPREFVDVAVQEAGRRGVSVAADHPSRGAVEPGEPVQAKSTEHAVDRGWGEPESAGDADGADLQPPAQPLDASFGGLWSASRTPAGAGRAVEQARLALRQPAMPPAVRGLSGNPHLPGDVGDGTSSGDALDEEQSSPRGEFRVSVQ